tara:strand:- start:29 stop:190 length:162 start_codon:yes stop_codon:yes gene_type:complete
MDSKKKLQKDVELALRMLHQTIDSLKEKVDKLCESSGCFDAVAPPDKSKKDEK